MSYILLQFVASAYAVPDRIHWFHNHAHEDPTVAYAREERAGDQPLLSAIGEPLVLLRT